MRTSLIAMGLLGLLTGAGCLNEDGEPIKAASWTEEKPAPARDIKEAPAPRISAATHLASGRMLEQQNEFAAAVRQYERALANNPNLVEAHNRLGIVYQRLERLADAEASFKKAIRIAPDSAMLHNNLGYCYLLQDKLDAAEKEFRDALAIAPTFERARMNVAIVLAKMDRTEESVAEFSQVVPPEVAYYNVAILCTERQQFPEARHALRRALKINPKYTQASDQLKRVTALARNMPPPDSADADLMADEFERAGEDAALQP